MKMIRILAGALALVCVILSAGSAHATCMRPTSPFYKPTYSAAVTGLAVAASATDVAIINGSATKTVCVLDVRVSCHGSSAVRFNIALIRRSTANSGGTSAAMTAVKNDTGNDAATATVLSYTANPTPGTAVGYVRADSYIAPTANNPGVSNFRFADRHDNQPLTLRGVAQGLAVSLEGQTVTGGECDISIEWSEESP